MAKYKFSIDDIDITNGNDGTEIQIDENYIAIIKIQSFVFRRRMYEPCSFEISLGGTITTENDDTPQEKKNSVVTWVKNNLKNSCEVNFSEKEKDIDLAEKYRIFNVDMAFGKEAKNTSFTIKLILFSPDKYLTLDNSCMAYTGRKLGDDIFEGKDKTADDKIGWGSIKTLADYLPSGFEMSKKNCLKNIVYDGGELRQPYLVQYNESFYHFLARSANRCGEFLYYENGSFILGLDNNCYNPKEKNKKNIVTIDATECVVCRHKKVASEGIKNDDINYFAYNYLDNNNRENNPLANKSFIFDDHQDADEYLNSVRSNFPKYFSFRRANLDDNKIPINGAKMFDLEWIRSLITPFLSGFLTNSALIGRSAALGGVAAGLGLFSELVVNQGKRIDRHNVKVFKEYFEKNKNYNSQFVVANDGRDFVYQFATPNKNIQNFGEKNSFGTLDNGGNIGPAREDDDTKAQNLTSAYYNLIKINEEEVERDMFTIQMNVSAIEDKLDDIRLGYIVNYNGKYYLIVDIQHSYCKRVKEKDEIDEINITMIPLINLKIDKVEFSAAIPYRLEDNIIRESHPVYGSVAFEYDPNFCGRIRVYFDWQKKGANGDATPWIRVVTPMASKWAMMRLTPQKNDLAIIDFENGNIEKPFVIGYKSDEDNKDHQKLKYLENGILTREGRGIIFNDTNVKNSFLRNTIFSNSFLTGKKNNKGEDNADNEYYGGDISIQDFRGLCSIKASTDKRQIDINSPFGSVKLNAFTGIEISAPNGDVEIMGKNVDIIASSRVTIKSGINLHPFYNKFRYEDLWDMALDKTSDLLVDLNFVRSFWGILFRPLEGDLAVNSQRHIIMEAGRGFVPYGVTQSVEDLYDFYSGLKTHIDNYLNSYKNEIEGKADDDVVIILDDQYMQNAYKKMPFKINKDKIESFLAKGTGSALNDLVSRKPGYVVLSSVMQNLPAASKVAGTAATAAKFFLNNPWWKVWGKDQQCDIMVSTSLGSVFKFDPYCRGNSKFVNGENSDIKGTSVLFSDKELFLEDIIYDFKMFLMKWRSISLQIKEKKVEKKEEEEKEDNKINIISGPIINDKEEFKKALKECLTKMCEENGGLDNSF